MIYNSTTRPEIIVSKTVPNGRFGDHFVSVQTQGGRYFYCNGWGDPLQCSYDDAMRHYNENGGH